MRDSCPSLTTPGVIARMLGVPLGRVQHILATRTHIRPSARAGTLRLYDQHAVAQVRYELNLIDARRLDRKSPDAADEAEEGDHGG